LSTYSCYRKEMDSIANSVTMGQEIEITEENLLMINEETKADFKDIKSGEHDVPAGSKLIETHSTESVDKKDDCSDLLNEDVVVKDLAEECSLVEEDCSSIDVDKKTTEEVKDPLSLSLYEAGKDESLDYSDDDFSDEEECTSDSDDEESEREGMKRMPLHKMQSLKVVGPNGEVKITQIPASIQVTRVPESKEAREKREQELARRKEMARNCGDCVPSPMKRKHAERMTLEDVRREDFEVAQDYVDFLQTKLKNISIKHCK